MSHSAETLWRELAELIAKTIIQTVRDSKSGVLMEEDIANITGQVIRQFVKQRSFDLYYLLSEVIRNA